MKDSSVPAFSSAQSSDNASFSRRHSKVTCGIVHDWVATRALKLRSRTDVATRESARLRDGSEQILTASTHSCICQVAAWSGSLEEIGCGIKVFRVYHTSLECRDDRGALDRRLGLPSSTSQVRIGPVIAVFAFLFLNRMLHYTANAEGVEINVTCAFKQPNSTSSRNKVTAGFHCSHRCSGSFELWERECVNPESIVVDCVNQCF